MSHRDITLKVMAVRRLNVADKPLYEVMRTRIGASLRGLRERGRLVSGEGKGAGVRWGIAGVAGE